MLVDELFTKALRSFETCVLVNNNLCGKLFSSLKSQITISDFNLWNCQVDSSTFKVLL